jgi:hypothetical protein
MPYALSPTQPAILPTTCLLAGTINNHKYRRSGVKNRQIPLANTNLSQYSVQDSFMHHVAKWGISADIFGGIDTAGSVSLRKLVKRNAKR